MNIKPCPFCGMSEQDQSITGNGQAVVVRRYPGGFRVECDGCCCMGPWHHQMQDAIESWNLRADVQPTDEPQHCLVCNGVGGHEEGCHGTSAYDELRDLAGRLAKALVFHASKLDPARSDDVTLTADAQKAGLM